MEDPISPPSDSDESPSDSDAVGKLRRWGRRLVWAVGLTVGAVVLVLALTLLGLQTETGATAAAQWLAGVANPVPNTQLTVEGARGNWLRTLELRGIALTRTDERSGNEVEMAHVDTLSVRYRLFPLLQGRVHINNVFVGSPRVSMHQRADSTWDWMQALDGLSAESPPAESDTTAGMPVRVDEVVVRDGAASATFYSPRQDSTAEIQGLELAVRDVKAASAITGRLDTLGLDAHLPSDPTTIQVAARGALTSTAFRLDTLRFESPRSQVRGGGEVRLPTGPNDSIDDVAFHVHADPLSLRDLMPFAPALDVDPTEHIRMDVEVKGSGRELFATVKGNVSNGGSLTADVAATPTTTTTVEGPPLRYRLKAQVQDLTTSLVGPPDPAENRVTAEIRVDLEGRSLDGLDGTADLRVADTRLGGVHTPVTTVTSTVRDGTVDATMNGTVNEARIEASGRTRPLATSPDAMVRARIDAFDVAAFLPDIEIDSEISATTEVRARNLGTDAQELDLTLSLGSSRVGLQRINSGEATLALNSQRVTAAGRLQLPEGAVQANGYAALDGTERFALETGRLDHLNLAAMVGDTTANRITATAQVTGQGFTPETMALDASLRLENSHYGPYEIPNLSSQVTLEKGQLTTTTDATVNGGQWTLGLSGEPFASTPTVAVERGRFRNVDMGPFLGDTTQSSQLHGTFDGRIEGTDPGTMTATLGLKLDASEVNNQRIENASVDLDLRDGTVRTTFNLVTPTGGTQLTARVRPFEDTPTFQVTEGAFDSIDVGAFADVSALSTDLSGTFTVDGRGATGETLVLDGDMSFADSRINSETLSAGQLSVAAERGRASASGRFTLGAGEIVLNGAVDSLGTTPMYTVQSTADSLDVGAVAGFDSTDVHVRSLDWIAEGRGIDPGSLTTSTALTVRNAQIDAFALDTLAARGTYRRGQLTVDTLLARSNAIQAQGRGMLAVVDSTAQSDFSMEAEVMQAAPLRSLLGVDSFRLQEGALNAHVYGESIAKQRFDGEATIRSLYYDDIRLTDAEINFNGQRGLGQLFRRVEVDGVFGFLSTPTLSTEEIRFDTVYDGTGIDVSTNVRLDETHTATLGAYVTPEAARTDVSLRRVNLRLDGSTWSLTEEARITIGDHYEIRNFHLRSGPQAVDVNGVVDPQGTQDLEASVENMNVGSVSSLFGLSGLEGDLSGSVNLTGPATAPQMTSHVAFDIQTVNRDVGTLRLDANYEELALGVDATLSHTDGSTLEARGTMPTDLRLRAPTAVDIASESVHFDVQTDRFPLDWVDPFIDPATARNVRGTLAADVAVRGSVDDPDLRGTASLADGGAYMPPLETQYRNVSGALSFEEDRVRLENGFVRSTNDGRLRAEGVINFPKLTAGEFDLRLDASNFIAIDTQAYRRAIIDGDLSVTGTTSSPVLSGSVQVQTASIYFNEALSESEALATTVPLTTEDQLILQERFGLRLSASDTTTFDVYEAMEMDLTVQIQRNTWLRSKSAPEMNIQFTGDLDVSKSPNEDPQVFGTIEVVTERSTLRQFGQEFQIREGTLTFNGDPYTPHLALEAVYEQRARETQGTEVAITLRLEGRPDDLTPTLTSTPPMDTPNILSYLATGRPADQLRSGSGGGGTVATQMALGQATNFVENLAASELGLDVVRVQIRTSGDSYLTVGRYFTPRFFVSIEQPVTNSNVGGSQSAQYVPDLTLEYQLLDTLMLRALNNQQSFQVNLLFEYAY